MTKLFVKKPFLTLVTIVIVLTIGIVSITKMPTDLMPKMELPYLAVVVTNPGASPEEIEEEVTKPVESALGTINGVENVISTSSNNYGMIMLEFAEDSNMDSALVRVSQQLDTLELPDGCGKPNLMEIGMDMMATMYVNVNYKDKGIKKLTTFSEKTIQPFIERQEGIASVSVSGAVKDSVEVRLNKKKIDDVNERIYAHAEEKLDDAQDEIDEGKDKITSGKSELKSQQKKLQNQQDSTNKKLADANTQLGKAQANKAAYEANLTSLKTSQQVLKAEKKGYQKAKIKETYNQMNSMFSGFQTSLGDMAAQSGVEIPKDLEDAVNHPKKFEAFKSWLDQLGYGDQVAQLTGESMKKVYDIVETRMPQIETDLANTKIKIVAAEKMVEQIDKQLKDLDKMQASAIAGAMAAAEGFGAGQAQISAAQSQLDNAKKEMDKAQEQLDDSRDTALDNANIDAMLTLDTLSGLISAQNFAMPAGYVDDKHDNQWLVEVGDEYKEVDDLENMVLTEIAGVGPIRLSDVADVTTIDNADESYSKVNGEDALMLAVFKSSTASTSTVSKNMKKAFKQMEDKYDGLSFSLMMDQGDYINIILNSVLTSILFGALLAIVILALFLKDVRPTLVVAFSIPFSVLFAIVIMYFTNITINVMSLAGLCLGIGMLVDNSIVVMENVFRLRKQGYTAPKAAVYGTKQVAGPIIASTITTICVFLPMVYTTGIISQLMIPFAFSISYALTASLLVALTVVPSLASVLLKRTKNREAKIYAKIQDFYAKILKFCLRFKIIPIVIAVGLLILCTTALSRMGLVLLDDMESNQISGTITMKDETDKETAYQIADQAIKEIMTVKGIDKVSVMDSSAGLISGIGGAQTDSYKSFMVNVITKDDIKTSDQFRKIIKEIKEKTKNLNCEEITIASSAIGAMPSMMDSGVAVNISGPDQDKMIEISNDVMEMVKNGGGVENVTNGLDEKNKQVHLTLNKNALAKHGLTVASVFQQISEKTTKEKKAVTLNINDTDIDVEIVKGKKDKLTYENLMNMKVKTTETDDDGKKEEKTYKLSKFAKAKPGYTMDSISRKNQKRYITVSAETKEGANATLLSRKLQEKIDQYDVPEGYEIEMSGESEQVADMVKQMLLAIALGCLLIYLVMVAQFQSLLSPFIILFTVPLAFTGGMIGLMVFRMSISAMALMGFMILMGTVVNNGIVFVDYVNKLRIKGVEKRTALIVTGKTRMRPIIMTALTTIFSMSVMAFSKDAGNAMQKSMAIVVCFGLIYATFMTLFIVPVLYDIFYRRKPVDIDVGDLDHIPDETEDLLREHGYTLHMEDKE